MSWRGWNCIRDGIGGSGRLFANAKDLARRLGRYRLIAVQLKYVKLPDKSTNHYSFLQQYVP